MRTALRTVAGWILRAFASAVLLWLVVRKLDLPTLGQLFRHIHWGWFTVAFGVMLGNRLLSCARLILLVRAKNLNSDPKEVARIVLASEFFGSFLPASVGSDVIRLYSLSCHTNNTPESASAVLMERGTGVIVLLFLGCIGALWAWPHLRDHHIVAAALIPSGVGLVVSLAALNERLVSAMARWVGLHGHHFVHKLLEWQRAIHAYRYQQGVVWRAIGISLAIQLLRIASAYFVGLALGARTSFLWYAAFIPLILLISLLPISIGGLGVRENAFVYCFGQVGVGSAMAFGISILAHALSVIAHAPGGIWSVWGRTRNRAATGPSLRQGAPLRVLWVADKLSYGDRLHGVGRYFLAVLPAMRNVEAIAAVLRSANGVAKQFDAHGIPLRELRQGRMNPLTWWTLARVIRRDRIDVLHVHGYGASTFGRLAGWLTHTPVVVHQHDSISRAPWYGRVLDRLCSPLTARAIAVSDSVKRFCIEERGLDSQCVTVLPNGIVSLPALAFDQLQRWRDEQRVPLHAKLIGSITRFHPVKGVQYLIDAMPRILETVPEAYLLLWGDGSERSALEAQARRLGVADRVRFLGYDEEAARRLSLLDCFVLPSLSEGQPFALLEAMAAGRPIVATKVGGVPELVQDQREALLVPPADAASLTRALIAVLKDPVLAQRLAAAAQQASMRHGIDQHALRLQQLYAEVMK